MGVTQHPDPDNTLSLDGWMHCSRGMCACQMMIGPPKGDSRRASAQRLQRDSAAGVAGFISLG